MGALGMLGPAGKKTLKTHVGPIKNSTTPEGARSKAKKKLYALKKIKGPQSQSASDLVSRDRMFVKMSVFHHDLPKTPIEQIRTHPTVLLVIFVSWFYDIFCVNFDIFFVSLRKRGILFVHSFLLFIVFSFFLCTVLFLEFVHSFNNSGRTIHLRNVHAFDNLFLPSEQHTVIASSLTATPLCSSTYLV